MGRDVGGLAVHIGARVGAVAGRGETVIVVGHQPDCGEIAAELGDGTEPRFPPAGRVELHLPGPSTS